MDDGLMMECPTDVSQEETLRSLREKLISSPFDTEQEKFCRSFTALKIQALRKDNQEMRERMSELERKSQMYLNESEKAKCEAADARRKFDDLMSALASMVSMDVAGASDLTGNVLNMVGVRCQDHARVMSRVHALEKRVASHDVESKASRETLKRLVTELEREQMMSLSRAAELNAIQQVLEVVTREKLQLEKQIQTLKKSLEETQAALDSAQRSGRRYQNLLEELDNKLLFQQSRAQDSHTQHQVFMENLKALVDDQCLPEHLREDDMLRVLTELRARERSLHQALREMKDRWLEATEQLKIHVQSDSSSEQTQQTQQQQIQRLEEQLLAARLSKEAVGQERQQYLCFLTQLSQLLKLDDVAAALGSDLNLELIETRVQQLVRHEGAAVQESRTQLYSLQRKLKQQKDRSDGHELLVELLRRKVVKLEEEKSQSPALLSERDEAPPSSKKLQKLQRGEGLQAELSTTSTSTSSTSTRFPSKQLQVQGRGLRSSPLQQTQG